MGKTDPHPLGPTARVRLSGAKPGIATNTSIVDGKQDSLIIVCIHHFHRDDRARRTTVGAVCWVGGDIRRVHLLLSNYHGGNVFSSHLKMKHLEAVDGISRSGRSVGARRRLCGRTTVISYEGYTREPFRVVNGVVVVDPRGSAARIPVQSRMLDVTPGPIGVARVWAYFDPSNILSGGY